LEKGVKMLDTDLNNFNEEAEKWAADTRAKLISKLDALGVKHSAKSPDAKAIQKSVTGKTGKQFDVVNRISFGFNRSGVFLSKGVSRGHPISNPREAKDWFNSVVEKELDVLADLVADAQGNMIINGILIK
jgi:hypothetical protein